VQPKREKKFEVLVIIESFLITTIYYTMSEKKGAVIAKNMGEKTKAPPLLEFLSSTATNRSYSDFCFLL